MGRRNLTVRGKTDGFGCQLNAKLSGIAFCFNNDRYRYVHTPFVSVSHGWRSKEAVDKINSFLNIPDLRKKHRINVSHKFMSKVFRRPNSFYVHNVLDHLRSIYWSNKEYNCLDQITIHIRRGDIQPRATCRHRGGWMRYQKNNWYNKIIPIISNRYPSYYPIVIHSEGKMEEFESITKGWPKSLFDRTIFKLADLDNTDNYKKKDNMLEVFHEMVSSKAFVQSKSGFSYTAGIFNENENYFHNGNSAIGQRRPLNDWHIVQDLI